MAAGAGGGGVGNVLQEFVIGIAYGIRDEAKALNSMKRVEDATKNLDATAKRLSETFNNQVSWGIRRVLTEVALLTSALAGIKALEGTFSRIKEISELSARTGAAANDVQDLASAFKSLGSSQKEAMSGLEALSTAIDHNPGVLNLLKSMGVTESQAGLKQTQQVGEALKRIIRQNGENGVAVALQYAKILGLSDEYVRLITDNYGKEEGSYARHVSRMKSIREAWGDDLNKASVCVETGTTTERNLAGMRRDGKDGGCRAARSAPAVEEGDARVHG